MKTLMLGNEAVARGLYEAGCCFVSSYPGTPSTEITECAAKYEEKKLCRTVGIGMAIISVLILVMGLFESILPASFAYIASGMIVIDCVGICIVGNTYCKK